MSVRLYVGNLPEEVDRQALEELFTSAGEVISTKVIRDRKTGKCRGFGFVTVNTQEQAQQYIEKFNGHSFGEVNLRIEIAQPRDKGEETNSRTAAAASEAKESGEKSGESRVPRKKQRNRGGKVGSGASATAEVGAASGPDPRWASQLQRIKEQLLQATNS
ncbi:MAG: RNA recognition motif domain-containing protein [Cyanobacteriota bacterium]